MTTSQFITTYEQPETLADELFGNELKGYGSELNGQFDESNIATVYRSHVLNADYLTNATFVNVAESIDNRYTNMFDEINVQIDALESENHTRHISMQTMINFLSSRIAELEKVVYNEK